MNTFVWSDLSPGEAWKAWRETKIRLSESVLDRPPVALDALRHPGAEAVAEMKYRCSVCNFARYEVPEAGESVEATSEALIGLARHFGLVGPEDHRSAGSHGVVALRTSSDEAKRGYIPYTRRPLSWHTDGYYNMASERVQGFILHCFRQALLGGENQLLDPEIAYLRLRDENPDYVRALMHPEAMAIPENREPDGSLRPESVGPVFFPDKITGRLQMRYTARTRSIRWRDDETTLAAADWLRDYLSSGDPLMRQVRLQAGQGIVNNNVLHNRTGFEDGASEEDVRIVLRVRFQARVAEELHGAA
ncbi:TauD/TfdA family dioxygenase [Aliiruegeria lutimaris]|uniref:TauD/TfdA family dioxygenase n=1 Tax=Aliiruegeria lutimaris TaxID=571298 RepID=UPI00147CF1D4|nr:TauD/TfdA family dioxygenase [Aliiruegeria lutimaris]